jgi:zinc transporter ZupT
VLNINDNKKVRFGVSAGLVAGAATAVGSEVVIFLSEYSKG